MDPMSLYQTYQAVAACYKGGKFAYEQADKKVAQFAEAEGITQKEAWKRVRAEAVRQADQRTTQAADTVLRSGALGVVLRTQPILHGSALLWRALKGRN
jgi:hypothetical protein